MLQSIAWLFLRKFKENHLIEKQTKKQKKEMLERVHWWSWWSQWLLCISSSLLKYYQKSNKGRLTAENISLQKLWAAHHNTMKSKERSFTRDNQKQLSSSTMHCFTTAPIRKLVFQKGTEPSCTSSTLLVKGKKDTWDLVGPLIAETTIP